MPKMDEGAFVIDYWAPAGAPLAEAERRAREIEKILSRNPDVQAYVRRTGRRDGPVRHAKQAAATSRSRCAPPSSALLAYSGVPYAPRWSNLEKELQAQGKTLEGEKENIRKKYRRRPADKVMEEVEDEIQDAFAEHQLKIELMQVMADELGDLSGANKPIEVKLFGPDQKQLRKLAEEVAETLETKGKGRGIKEVNSQHVRAGNPDLMIRVDGFYADKLGLKPDAIARQLRRSSRARSPRRCPSRRCA